MGRWTSNTFAKWWLTKLGIVHDEFQNEYLLAGTHFEHRILDSLGLKIKKDGQYFVEEVRLRVNLDGETEDTIYEVKTYKAGKPFKVPKKYIQQVCVQMYATGKRRAYIVAYALEEEDYKNFLRPIDLGRLQLIPVEYDEDFIHTVFLPRIQYLARCLIRGVFPLIEDMEAYS